MDKSALRKFAIDARNELIEKVKLKALQFGISEEDIKSESIVSSDAVFIEGRQLSIEEQRQRNKLIEEIKVKGYDQVIEEVAYTWFNRFTALRFMEVNNYLLTKVRVLSSATEGSYEPDIIREALNVKLDIDKELVYNLKLSTDNDAIDKLYKYLIIKQCNALNDILPLMFEKILDYTELLFPDGILAEGSFLRVMTDTTFIPEEDWENVEIIGWLYQFYISERKDEVFEGLRKNKKINKDDIAPATQLFTPHWIVRYMVENSVGKLWQEGHPNEELKQKWKYYLEEVEQEEEVQKQLDKLREESKKIKVEDIKIIDPSMGSGHILAYAFDLLYDIYLSEGYISQEIPKLIIEKNLYGLDIDKRAFQLAYFALMMKGRSKSRRFFNEKVEVNICAIEESNELLKNENFKMDDSFWEYFLETSNGEERKELKESFKYLLDAFYDAKEYGSILKVKKINFDLIEKRLDEIKNEAPENIFKMQYKGAILDTVPDLVKQGRILSDKYDVMITNPPYMGSKGMNATLSNFVKREYPDTKADLFAVFMELDEHLVRKNGYMAMINQHSWMFLSSFENYRKRLLENRTIDTMLHLGPRAFEEIGGEVVQSTAFVNRKVRLGKYKGIYIRLIDFDNADMKEEKTKEAIENLDVNYRFTSMTDNFNKIPGNPVAYWFSKIAFDSFSNNRIDKYVNARIGLISGDNNRFLRLWHEVDIDLIGFNICNISNSIASKKKWFPYQKGGEFRKWYGNHGYLVNWENDGYEMKFNNSINGRVRSHNYNGDLSFNEGITWSSVTSGTFSCRYSPKGFMFDAAGPLCKVKNKEYLFLVLSYLTSKVANEFLFVLNPTINMHPGYIQSLPFKNERIYYNKGKIDVITKTNISISRTDWDSFETSWDFKIHPLLNKDLRIQNEENKRENTIEEAFNNWKEFTENQFNQLKSNEEELNRIFIEIYGLQDELTPEVEDKDITISKVVEEKTEEDKKNAYTIDRKEVIQSFISYAVGCMFGRYSLDEEGLAYAGGEFDPSKYNTFSVDEDNVIPILSDSYFEDDIVLRFVDFVRVTFGEDTLNENIEFIAESLGVRKNETPKDTIRRYFLNDFYKDHVKKYKKRPIYWLFTSGKQKAFNALIYMHRYDSSTLARMRTDYLHVLQSRLHGERESMLDRIDLADSVKERKGYEKELKDIDKKIDELKEYDELLHHMADMQMEIDLDDGVKVNYAKFNGLVEKI